MGNERIKVLTFSKVKYGREELEAENEVGKYHIASNDSEWCRIYDAEQYTKRLNDYVPMENQVYTYIVSMYSNE